MSWVGVRRDFGNSRDGGKCRERGALRLGGGMLCWRRGRAEVKCWTDMAVRSFLRSGLNLPGS